MKNTKALFGIVAVGLVVLVGWLVYSHHQQVLATRQAEEAYFNAEETFQLPAANGGNTSFKDIENSFRDTLSPNYQSVAVKTIELACTAQEVSHQVDDRISGSEVTESMAHGETYNRKDLAAIDRYNNVARHGTVSDGSDISWGVNVSVTHRVRKSSDNTTPLSVEWVCPNPSSASRLPICPSGDLPTLALNNYGIQLNHVKRMNLTDEEWDAEGILGTNKFKLTVGDICRCLSPASEPTLLESPIINLSWNGSDVFPISTAQNTSSNDPVLNLSEIKTLAAWAQSCIPTMLAADDPKLIEISIPIYLDFSVGRENMVGAKIGSYQTVLIGAVLKPFVANPTSSELGKFTVKGLLFTHDRVQRLLVQSMVKASD